MLREIVLDTETTGLDAKNGDRLIEIGGLELVNRMPTGRELHYYFNPEGREIHPEAVAVHGMTAEFLRDKPPFSAVAAEFLAFIGDTALVIHNAGFDVGFINAELERVGQPLLKMERVVDTLILARRKHPAGPNSLDALCKRYGIDTSRRTKHGALLDSALLASVYVELLGARQATLVLAGHEREAALGDGGLSQIRPRSRPLAPRLTPAEADAHRAFVATLGPGALWHLYQPA